MEVTYSNVFYLSGEDRLYNFVRTDDRSPNVMVSDESIFDRDAPALRTVVAPEQPGTYDVWTCFWADLDADWRLQADLDGHSPVLARQISTQRVAPGAVEGLEPRRADSTFLYQTYVGRAAVQAGPDWSVRRAHGSCPLSPLFGASSSGRVPA